MRFNRSSLSFAILIALSTSIHANDLSQAATSLSIDSPIPLSPIVLQAEKTVETGTTAYTKEDLEKKPNSSKNITDFLKVNPNVQFSQAQNAAGSQGEIKPAEMSINGAQTFQNNFIVNGVSNNLTINPTVSTSNTYHSFGTGSQAMAINTDLLCKLVVLDSNVFAAYGQFTGGIISTETCAPQTEIGKIHGSVTYDYTESDWARYNAVTELEEDLFEEPSETYQKEYVKQGISANIYGTLSENWGFNSYASNRRSVIPVISGFDQPKKIDQKRNNINLGSTFFYTPTESLKAKFGFAFGNLNNLGYSEGRRNSKSTIKTETLTIFSELEHRIGPATVTHKLNYQNSDSQRNSENNYGFIWHYAEGSKDWTNSNTVSEGAILGNLKQEQTALAFETNSAFDNLKIGETSHIFKIGTGFNHTEVDWKRANDVYMSNVTPNNLKDLGTYSCLDDDWLCDENTTIKSWSGQYFASGTIYKAGKFSAQQDSFHLFAEDGIQWKNITTRLGARADYDSLSRNFNIAPRSSFSYKPFGNDKLQVLGGLNRYYGQQTLGTELNDAIGELIYKMTRSNPQEAWTESFSGSATGTRRSELDTPFSDESVFGINTQIKNIDLGVKWVNRKYRDEISRTKTNIPKDGFNYSYEYGNDGKGEADIYSLTIKNHQPLVLGTSLHSLSFGFDYSDIYRSYTDFTSNYIEADQDKLISYNGDIIHWSERPAQNFSQPWTARLNWDIVSSSSPLKISNFFSYKDSYNDMISNGNIDYNGEKLNSYIASEIKPKFTWDMRTTYDFKIAKNLNVIFGLTINNVTNRVNTYTTLSTISSKPRVMTELGRQFIADITFKF